MATIQLSVKIDGGAVAERYFQPFQEANELLGRQLQQAITSNIWLWTDGLERDIVDDGALRDSYTPNPLSNTEYEHTWDKEYAAAVLLGAVFETRQGSLPARNWVLYVLRKTDFAALTQSLLDGESV